MSDSALPSGFKFGERVGLLFTVEGAVLSIIAVSFILGFAVYKWLRWTVFVRGKGVRRSDASDSSIFLNLMLADLIQAIGIMPNIKWLGDAAVTEGTLCTAQAALKQVGIVGVALTSLAIAFHTFAILVLRWRPPRHSSKLIVLGIWIFTGLVIGIPKAVHGNGYYGANGYWCWIVHEYKAEQIVTEYLWVWVAGFSMMILYTVMYTVMRGWFIIDNGIHWHETYDQVNTGAALETEEDRETKVIARMMLYYPAVYILCFLPNSISRWLYFRGTTVNYKFALFANTVFALSGVFNFVLFFFTRPSMVVGEAIVIEQVDIPHTPTEKRSYSEHTSSSLGRLPDRTYSAQGHEMQNLEFESSSRTQTQQVLPNHDIHQSPKSRQESLPPARSSYLGVDSRDQYSRGRRAAPIMDEEEDYGHLPH